MNQHAPPSSLKSARQFPILDQDRLNISERRRTSRLAWRGQFSPELVEHFIQQACAGAQRFYDPFAGSGTVLFEALKQGRSACGVEVNPAAWHLAALSRASAATPAELRVAIATLEGLLNDIQEQFDALPTEAIFERIRQSVGLTGLALSSALLVGMGNKSELTWPGLCKGASSVLKVLHEAKVAIGTADCLLRDARKTGLPDQSFDAVITSPPYINVFNYHQNYRPACELLGWKPLQAAQAEIGSNRKNRQNRFLTVVQYCIDMHNCLMETARLVEADAPLIIVLGRTSTILGESFKNGDLIKSIIEASGQFGEVHTAERVFIGRYGDRIYEDILVAHKSSAVVAPSVDPRTFGISALQIVRETCDSKNASLLDDAIARGASIGGSPDLLLDVPPPFRQGF